MIRRRLLTTDEAAELVGVKVATIRKWKQRGKLAPFSIEPDLYLDVDVYDASSKQNRRVACAETGALSQ